MLKFTPEEKTRVADYFLSQSSEASISFLQKVYSESVIGHAHDVWDLHADDGRWWIITNPTNLYSQEQFPNLDLALTFHMGLCLRIPQGDKEEANAGKVWPFAEVLNAISQCDDALSQANDSGAYRAIGVRCREALLGFIHAAQDACEWPAEAPKRSDFPAWVETICNAILAGPDNRERRRLLKTSLKEAWAYVNWLTHSKSGTWLDAEMANNAVSYALGMGVSIFIREMRGVPDQCPECESCHLDPEEGINSEQPEVLLERPVCLDCGWVGEPVPLRLRNEEEMKEIFSREGENSAECGTLAIPLTGLKQPD
ncbi:MAG: hypothetical protein ABJN05_06320 [Sulfitobacter dubius]